MKSTLACISICLLCGCRVIEFTDPVTIPIRVEGDIAHPGEYVLFGEITLRKGVAAAGGFTDTIQEVQIIRHGTNIYSISGSELEHTTKYDEPILQCYDVIVITNKK